MVVMEKFPNQRLRSDCLGLCFLLYHFVLHLAILCESFNHRWVTESLHHHRQCYRVFLWQSVKHNLDRRMHLSRIEQHLEPGQYYFPSMKVTFSWNTSFFFCVWECHCRKKYTECIDNKARESDAIFWLQMSSFLLWLPVFPSVILKKKKTHR